MNNQLAPAGWYPDPSGGAGQRYWDGTEWTAATSPSVSAVDTANAVAPPTHAPLPASPAPAATPPVSTTTPPALTTAPTAMSASSPATAGTPPVAGMSTATVVRHRLSTMPRYAWILVALALGLGVLALVNRDDGTRDITGEFELNSSDYSWLDRGEPCRGRGGYGDVNSGTQVTVRDGSGALLATSSLRGGRADGGSCVFEFTLSDVPRADYYTFEVGRRGELSYSREDLLVEGWHVGFTLGGY
jgi:hypothetical protein